MNISLSNGLWSFQKFSYFLSFEFGDCHIQCDFVTGPYIFPAQVPFLLADSTDSPDIDGVCFDSTFYVKPDVKINTPELYLVTDGNYVFNHRRQSVYNMTIGIYVSTSVLPVHAFSSCHCRNTFVTSVCLNAFITFLETEYSYKWQSRLKAKLTTPLPFPVNFTSEKV